MPENSEVAKTLKAEIFDLIEQQDKLAMQAQAIERQKQAELKPLQVANQKLEDEKQEKLQALAAERARVEAAEAEPIRRRSQHHRADNGDASEAKTEKKASE
jgi:hypothetical protein